MSILKKATQDIQNFLLNANEVKALFNNSYAPNVFQIRNFGTDIIYLSTSPNVSEVNFEMNIIPSGTRVYINTNGLKVLYLFSKTSGKGVITSWEATEISATDLDQTQISAIVNQTITPNVTVINPLPSGTNHLGTVTLDNANIQVTTQSQVEVVNDIGNPLPCTIPALPTGTNNIGKVDINSLPVNNFIPLAVTLVANTDFVVKASAGHIAKISSTLTDIIVKNNTVTVWGNISKDDFSNPIYCDHDITLNSVTGGQCFISFN